MARILAVDDDLDISMSIRNWLEHEHHQVESVHTGDDAKHHLRIYQYDLIILDWQLPGITGVEILKEFRSNGGSTPVIMLTGKDKISEKETGFDAGADDYLTKPFHIQELLMRCRALLRRGTVSSSDELSVADLSLDLNKFKVTRGGKEITLTAKEFALLEHLMRHPNQIFSSESLLESVWGSQSEASTDTVRVIIQRLRSKIDGIHDKPLIANVRGIGYKLSTE
ncbi:MAG: response regulator transcription factor [Candidatus Obscuribacterales bacterium]|nr:response regulator transcription factor [Candidatus Obscuribacterales bacterium]